MNRRSSTIAGSCRVRSLRGLVIAAGLVPLTVCGSALAQFRIDNSNALDRSNRLGSNGFNTNTVGGNGRFGGNGLAGNFIVTGSVSGGRAFRGSLGYTDPNAFRGTIAGGFVDTFTNNSAGFDNRGVMVNNAGNVDAVFGRNIVVAPQGFQTRLGGGIVQNAPAQFARSFDTRIDFGGLTRQQIASTPSRINLLKPSDGAGVAGTLGQPMGSMMSSTVINSSPRAQLPDSLASVDILSEYTALTRRSDLTPSQMTARQGQPSQPSGASASLLPSGQLNNSDLSSGAATDRNRLSNAGLTTGQGSGVRDLTVPQRNNAQLNELQRRLDQIREENGLRGKDADSIREVANERVRRQQEAARKAAEDARRTSKSNTNTTTDNRPTDTRPGDNRTGDIRPGDNRTGDGRPGDTRPGGNPTLTPTTPRAVAPANTNIPDLNLPSLRPPTTNQPGVETGLDATRTAPTSPTTVDPTASPLNIRSLADGTTGDIRNMVTRAEQLMREGRFASAIDQFDAAERVSPDDPMLFMGRSIAELGASYFRRAEVHLRQAFERSPELLLARYDLKAMIGEARLEFLVGELKQLSTANANDPGPLMLLAFIHYSVEDTARASALLAEAQRRSPNDQSIKLMQATWQLESPTGNNK